MSSGNRKKLLWLQSGGCGGCTLSLTCAQSPDFLTAFDIAGIDLIWHPTLSEETGSDVTAILDKVLNGEIKIDIFCLEGSVVRGPNGSGRFHMMSGMGKPMQEIITAVAKVSEAVVAVGSCAAYGGVTSGGTNPVEACGLSFDKRDAGGLLGEEFTAGSGMPVVNISGCPTHPDWVTETLFQIAADQLTSEDLDVFGRPKSISNHLVHHGCSRNEFYEFKASADQLSGLGCLMENLGCMGTQACGDCNTRHWNGSGSCISGGYPCIACTEPGFEEPDHAFVETPKIAGIPIGIPTDMPKAWFVALASLSKAATPKRLKENAHSDHILVPPAQRKKPEAS
jgi:uptake hydrogenase small subunit